MVFINACHIMYLSAVFICVCRKTAWVSQKQELDLHRTQDVESWGTQLNQLKVSLSPPTSRQSAKKMEMIILSVNGRKEAHSYSPVTIHVLLSMHWFLGKNCFPKGKRQPWILLWFVMKIACEMQLESAIRKDLSKKAPGGKVMWHFSKGWETSLCRFPGHPTSHKTGK